MCKTGFLAVLLLYTSLFLSDAYIIMSIDFGSRFIKNGILRRGYQAEIVYDEGGRKFSTAVGFHDQPPKVGDEAYRLLPKYPGSTIVLFAELLSPNYNLSNLLNHVHLLLRENNHTLEESLAMLIRWSAKRTTIFADGQDVDTCILAVPFYFNFNERHKLIALAEAVDLNVSAVVSGNLAAAFSFGLFHTKEFEKNPITIMIIDIGSTTTRLSLFELSHKRFEDSKQSVPSLTTIYNGVKHNLGTVHFQLIIMDMLIRQIENKGHSRDHFSSKIIPKLFVQSERILERLAFNNKIDFSIENLINGDDFEFHISKDDFDALAYSLVQSIQSLLVDTLANANVSKENIKQVIPLGGGSRISIIESTVCQFLDRSVFDRRINVDEGIALGSVYYAASFSQFFKTKKFSIRDLLSYTVKIIIPPVSSKHNETIISIFTAGSLYPKRRSVTLRNRLSDFSIYVLFYDGQDSEMHCYNTSIDISGVNEAQVLYPSGSQHLGIKISFQIDEAQQFIVDKIEYRVRVPQASTKFQNLKDKFFRTFGLNSKENETLSNSLNNSNSQDNQNGSSTSSTDNSSSSNDTTNSTKMVLQSTLLTFIINNPKRVNLQKEIKKRLDIYEKQERYRVELEKLQNDFEAWLYEWSSKVTDDNLLRYVKPQELAAINQAIVEKREWFDEFGFSADRTLLRTKYLQLLSLTDPIVHRMTQYRQSDLSLRHLSKIFNITKRFLKQAVNLTEIVNISKSIPPTPRNKPLLQSEYDYLDNMLNETMLWLDEITQNQSKLSLTDDPVLVPEEIDGRSGKLARELEYLNRKIRYFIYPRNLNTSKTFENIINKTSNNTVFETFPPVESISQYMPTNITTTLDSNQTINASTSRDEL